MLHRSRRAESGEALAELENVLSDRLATCGVGAFHSSSQDDHRTEMAMYGADTDALWAVIEPVVRAAAGPGDFAVKRYGDFGSAEVVIPLP